MKKILVTMFIAAVAVLGLSSCSSPVSSSGPNLTCTDKVVQSEVTDRAVSGVWNCLTPALQKALQTYVQAGMAISADDAVFTDGNNTAPPILTTKFIGESNGVAVYAIVVKRTDGTLITLTMILWVDSSGKVDNVTVSGPTF